jgi:hypothetical protein
MAPPDANGKFQTVTLPNSLNGCRGGNMRFPADRRCAAAHGVIAIESAFPARGLTLQDGLAHTRGKYGNPFYAPATSFHNRITRLSIIFSPRDIAGR